MVCGDKFWTSTGNSNFRPSLLDSLRIRHIHCCQCAYWQVQVRVATMQLHQGVRGCQLQVPQQLSHNALTWAEE